MANVRTHPNDLPEDAAGIWDSHEIWSRVFAVGDAVRALVPVVADAAHGVIEVYERPEQDWIGTELVSKEWVATVRMSTGHLSKFRPRHLEKSSLLEVMAEAARLSPLQVLSPI